MQLRVTLRLACRGHARFLPALSANQISVLQQLCEGALQLHATLRLARRGHVRVQALSANQILAVPGLGDHQMQAIRAWLPPSAAQQAKRGRDKGATQAGRACHPHTAPGGCQVH